MCLLQLAAQGFFEDVDDPLNGVARHSVLPIRFGQSRIHRQHGPLLGEHKRELLTELGSPETEVDEFENGGVIGRALPT